ncbi:hypothetical protein CPLU01_07065 [Colletotrichum plurivorum]|uniref:Uncharacterized protein n=1 Tax=Colletotrichum plurivorum TaxID=2175906 RepID=A0A8H6KHJ7_9PEZI|nr:hypothetical protein CPLU01_07065 [Colletotrichum plurivorum]
MTCEVQSRDFLVSVTDPALCSGAGGIRVAGNCCVHSNEQSAAYYRLCGQRGDPQTENRGVARRLQAETRC